MEKGALKIANSERIAWQELKKRIQTEIRPGKTCIPYRKGCRLVTSNDGLAISMRTGENDTKAIPYEMVKWAFDTLSNKKSFDSQDFCARFGSAYYKRAPCRFSMTGGVLVDLGLANMVVVGTAYRYTIKPFC
jgi:hypothetical protein